jgi:hypothetical protein
MIPASCLAGLLLTAPSPPVGGDGRMAPPAPDVVDSVEDLVLGIGSPENAMVRLCSFTVRLLAS